MVGREAALEMFSPSFPSCSKGSLRQESLVLFLESSTSGVIQGISQHILCCFGPSQESRAEVHAPCSGNSSGRCFWSQGTGSAWSSQWERVRAGQVALVQSFSMVQWELLISVHSISGVQELRLPRGLRKWLFGLPSACPIWLELARSSSSRHSICVQGWIQQSAPCT